MSNFNFTLESSDGRARTGRFTKPHGELLTPVFAPVGTAATVKAITPAQLHEIGASLVLANTYHLFLQPGTAVVKRCGGVQAFASTHSLYWALLTSMRSIQNASIESLTRGASPI